MVLLDTNQFARMFPKTTTPGSSSIGDATRKARSRRALLGGLGSARRLGIMAHSARRRPRVAAADLALLPGAANCVRVGESLANATAPHDARR
jgi:hypothetical protein